MSNYPLFFWLIMQSIWVVFSGNRSKYYATEVFEICFYFHHVYVKYYATVLAYFYSHVVMLHCLI